MQDASILVNGSVDNGMARPAVLGLHVKYLLADLHIGVETGTHRAECSVSGHSSEGCANPINGEFI